MSEEFNTARSRVQCCAFKGSMLRVQGLKISRVKPDWIIEAELVNETWNQILNKRTREHLN